MPAKKKIICSLFVLCHSTINAEPKSACRCLSSLSSFSLSARERICSRNVSLEALVLRFSIYEVWGKLESMCNKESSIKYLKGQISKFQVQGAVAPVKYIKLS